MVPPVFDRRCNRCLCNWHVAGANVSHYSDPCRTHPSSPNSHWYVSSSLTITGDRNFRDIGSIGWISGVGQAGSAMVPFMVGAIAQTAGMKVLQPVYVS